MKPRLKVEIYRAANKQRSFRVTRGSRIILTPGETYRVRGGVRRAVRNLAGIATDHMIAGSVSQLQADALAALEREQRAWDARPR